MGVAPELMKELWARSETLKHLNLGLSQLKCRTGAWLLAARHAHPFPPLTLKVPRSGCESIRGLTFELLGVGHRDTFHPRSLSYLDGAHHGVNCQGAAGSIVAL